jgi:hypothetical protein
MEYLMTRNTLIAAATLALLPFAAMPASSQDNPKVGGAPMYVSKNIVENAVNSKDHTTLERRNLDRDHRQRYAVERRDTRRGQGINACELILT